jgi:hypothetical protein
MMRVLATLAIIAAGLAALPSSAQANEDSFKRVTIAQISSRILQCSVTDKSLTEGDFSLSVEGRDKVDAIRFDATKGGWLLPIQLGAHLQIEKRIDGLVIASDERNFFLEFKSIGSSDSLLVEVKEFEEGLRGRPILFARGVCRTSKNGPTKELAALNDRNFESHFSYQLNAIPIPEQYTSSGAARCLLVDENLSKNEVYFSTENTKYEDIIQFFKMDGAPSGLVGHWRFFNTINNEGFEGGRRFVYSSVIMPHLSTKGKFVSEISFDYILPTREEPRLGLMISNRNENANYAGMCNWFLKDKLDQIK